MAKAAVAANALRFMEAKYDLPIKKADYFLPEIAK